MRNSLLYPLACATVVALSSILACQWENLQIVHNLRVHVLVCAHQTRSDSCLVFFVSVEI